MLLTQKTPLISIVLATYNPNIEFFIKQINSLKVQTYTNWECIIIDDCSTNEKFEEIRKIASLDKRFSVYQNSINLGSYHTFEEGLKKISPKAELIAFCDQDDIWLPVKLERCLESITPQPPYKGEKESPSDALTGGEEEFGKGFTPQLPNPLEGEPDSKKSFSSHQREYGENNLSLTPPLGGWGATPRVLNSANKITYTKLNLKTKEMRHNPTKAEATLWEKLSNKSIFKYKFRRQHIIDCYIADFYCIEKNLVIEIDGKVHDQQIEEDKLRQEKLELLGCKVIRFTNEEVLYNLDFILKSIFLALENELGEKPPNPLKGEKGLGGDSTLQPPKTLSKESEKKPPNPLKGEHAPPALTEKILGENNFLATPPLGCWGASCVHSDLSLIDSKDNLTHKSCWEFEGRNTQIYDPQLLILRNTITGCSMMFRREVLELALPFPKQEIKNAFHHDLWIALISLQYGSIKPINDSLVLYRQHGNNVVGASKSSLVTFLRNLSKFKNPIEEFIKRSIFQWQSRKYLSKVYIEKTKNDEKNYFDGSILRLLYLGLMSLNDNCKALRFVVYCLIGRLDIIGNRYKN